MPVAFQSVGTVGVGSTSVTAGLPASLATGDGVLLRVLAKPDTATIVTPTDWTLIVDVAGGGGTQGNGTGPSRQAVFWREKDAGWSTMPAVTVTSGNASAAIAERWTKDTGAAWAVAAASGAYSGNGTAWSAAMDVDPGLIIGDGVSVGCSNQDDAPTWSAQAIAATGATFGSVTERSEAVSTTTGQDLGGMVFTAAVTAGPASAAATVTGTASAASRGTTALVRLRQTPAFVDDFNRANGALGANWSVLNGASLTVVSNEAASPDANTNHMKTVAVVSSSNMYAQATMKTSGASLGVGARFPSSASETGYVWRYNGTDCTLFVVSAGSFSSIGSAYTATLSVGAVLRIEVEGTAIRGYVDGVLRASATNSTVTSGGNGSLRIGGTAGRLDDYSIGLLTSVPAAGSVAGTWTFAETVAGVSSRSGAVAGSWTFGESVVGSRQSRGAAAGSWVFAESLVGSSPNRGTVAGSWVFSEALTGSTVKSGAVNGAWSFAETVDGYSSRGGAVAGAFGFVESVTGANDHDGAVAGSWSFLESIAGETDRAGDVAGSWMFAETVTGNAPGVGPSEGTIAGSWVFVEQVTGSTTHRGTVAGSWVFVEHVTGPALPVELPPDRTRVVAAEQRTRLVAAEQRTRVVAVDENRTRYVAAENRTRRILT